MGYRISWFEKLEEVVLENHPDQNRDGSFNIDAMKETARVVERRAALIFGSWPKKPKVDICIADCKAMWERMRYNEKLKTVVNFLSGSCDLTNRMLMLEFGTRLNLFLDHKDSYLPKKSLFFHSLPSMLGDEVLTTIIDPRQGVPTVTTHASLADTGNSIQDLEFRLVIQVKPR
jgi:hypothetical protein